MPWKHQESQIPERDLGRADDRRRGRDQPARPAPARQGGDDDVRLPGVHGHLLSRSRFAGVGRARRRVRGQEGRHLCLGRRGVRHALGIPRDLAPVDPERRLVSGGADLRRGGARLYGGRPDLAQNGIFVGLFCIVVYWSRRPWSFAASRSSPSSPTGRSSSARSFLASFCSRLLGYWLAAGHPIGWQHLTTPRCRRAGRARVLAGDHRLRDDRVPGRDRPAIRRRRGAGGAHRRDAKAEPGAIRSPSGSARSSLWSSSRWAPSRSPRSCRTTRSRCNRASSTRSAAVITDIWQSAGWSRRCRCWSGSARSAASSRGSAAPPRAARDCPRRRSAAGAAGDQQPRHADHILLVQGIIVT